MSQGNIYDAFVDGMRKGWKVATLNMLPNVVLAFVLIKALKLSGLLEIMGEWFSPVMSIFGLPGEAVTVLLSTLFSAGGGMGYAFFIQGHAFGQRSIAAFQRSHYGLQACQPFFE